MFYRVSSSTTKTDQIEMSGIFVHVTKILLIDQSLCEINMLLLL